MAKKQSNTGLLISAALVAGFLLFRRKPAVEGIGAMTQQLHLLQAVNNDYQRIKKQKWKKSEIPGYLRDVQAGYSTPLFMLDEPLLKGSTTGSGDVNKDSQALKEFLRYNKAYINEQNYDYFDESEFPLYTSMLIAYARLLADMFDIEL